MCIQKNIFGKKKYVTEKINSIDMRTTARTPKTASRKRLFLIRREEGIKDIMRIQEYPKGGNGELGE